MNLYEKHRPKTFAEMEGDFSFFDKMLEKEHHSHVFLFTGIPGSGKSASAHALSNAVHANPSYKFHVNCGDDSSVETIRSFIEMTKLPPMADGPYFIMLDECQKLTNSAQNALLIPLENTPEYVYWVLCSSEPEKLIPALKTRCTLVNYPGLPERSIRNILKRIADAEGFDIPKMLLGDIAEIAEGSARRAIVIMEEIAAASEDQQESLLDQHKNNFNDDSDVANLCKMLYLDKPMWSDVVSCLSAMKNKGVQAESIRRTILSWGMSMILRGNKSESIPGVMRVFKDNVFDSDWAGLTIQCFSAYNYLIGKEKMEAF